jgi:hypothetical protein
MQHVVNIAFDFDDEKVTKIAEAAIENDINSIIEKIIKDYLAPEHYTYWDNKTTRSWEGLSKKIDARIDAMLNEHKDEIIEMASDKLVMSYQRTKAWKEKVNQKLDKEDK